MGNRKKIIKYLGAVGKGSHGEDACWFISSFLLNQELTSLGVNFNLVLQDDIRTPDFVICGGGTILNTTTNKINDWIQNNTLARVCNGKIPFGILGTGIMREAIRGKFEETKETTNRLKQIIKEAKIVCVRDPFSVSNLQSLKIDTTSIIIGGDPALHLSKVFPLPQNPKNLPNILGVNTSIKQPSVDGVVSGINEETIPTLLSNFYTAHRKDFNVARFVSLNKYDINTIKYFPENLFKEIYSYTPNVKIIIPRLTENKLVIGYRMHSAIVCCSYEIPFIPLVYKLPFRGFLHSISYPFWLSCTDLTTIALEGTYKSLKLGWENYIDILRIKKEEYWKNYYNSIKQLAKIIKEI